ncbi:hypothetical protein SLE2022_207460 [Rubroshorea leprosula]
MATKSRVSFVFLLLSILVLFAGFAFACKLELKQCKHQCKVQQQFDGDQKEACMERCKDCYTEKKEREGEDPHDFSMEYSGKKLTQCMAQYRSNLLRVVENHRLGVLVVYPDAFVAPNHLDADALFVVTQGKGTVSLILENKRESFNVECGDLFRIPPGTPVYLINRDENEKLYVVNLIQTINVPGQCEVFFSRGGKRGISIFAALSWNILEAALKTSRDQLERLVSYVNLTKGSMSGPYFHSKSTNLCIVVKGRGGHFEMACPHVSKQDSKDKEWKSSPRYQKKNAPLETDTVFIVPPGHPFVTVASKNSNMEILCFEVNAEGNIRYSLAGKRNILKLFEKEAKELVFKSKVEEVDQVFNNQDEEMFFPGPRQEGGHSYI